MAHGISWFSLPGIVQIVNRAGHPADFRAAPDGAFFGPDRVQAPGMNTGSTFGRPSRD
ncbi:MAG: hypothetical protein WD028_00110 [Balneolaceae bacterium]